MLGSSSDSTCTEEKDWADIFDDAGCPHLTLLECMDCDKSALRAFNGQEDLSLIVYSSGAKLYPGIMILHEPASECCIILMRSPWI